MAFKSVKLEASNNRWADYDEVDENLFHLSKLHLETPTHLLGQENFENVV